MKKGNSAPLIYALSQVVFSPILEMKEYVGDIQEKFRHLGFPKYTKKDMMAIKFDGANILPQEKKESWNFANKDNTKNIVLTTEYITLETSEYSSYEDFIKVMEGVLDVLQKVANPSLCERVGLRYVNLVKNDTKGFSYYLHKSILGFPVKTLSNDFASTQCVTSVKTKVGNLLLKCSLLNNGRFLSHDLSQDNIKFDVVLGDSKEVAILDIDHFLVQTKDFNKDEIISDLNGLRSFIKKAFLGSITPEAKKEWGVK